MTYSTVDRGSLNFFKDLAYIHRPYQTFLNPQTPDIDYRYFDQFKNQLVIINFSSEHWNGLENHIYEQLDKTNINFLLLTYNHISHRQYPRMFYFPYWYHDSIQSYKSIIVDTSSSRNYVLGCLNGNSRPHRIANFLKLRKKHYWENTSISFFDMREREVASSTRFDDLPLSNDEIHEWENIRKLLPIRTPVTLDHTNLLNLPQLNDSYLHLVTETTVIPSIFITEKTWKPVVTGVPFVMWGNPGAMYFLKSQGVDIYDDVIDHKYYDAEEDARVRLDKLYVVIDDLILHGVDKIYNQLVNRTTNNQTKFFGGEFDQTYVHELTNAIKQYT